MLNISDSKPTINYGLFIYRMNVLSLAAWIQTRNVRFFLRSENQKTLLLANIVTIRLTSPLMHTHFVRDFGG